MFVILRMFYVFMLIFWIQIVYHLCLLIWSCLILCLVELHVYVSGFDGVFSWNVFTCLKFLIYEWFWQQLFSSVFGHEIVYCVFSYLKMYFVCLFYWNYIYTWMVVWMFIYEYLYLIWNCNHVFVLLNYEFQCVCIM